MNSIEEKLWNYIDGTCTPQEQAQISELIIHDQEYKQQYDQLLQFHNEFKTMELDEPPMAFTYHVMEQIRAQEALVPLKAAINKRIIHGIAAFFVLTILGIVGYTLMHINWSDHQSNLQVAKLNVPEFNSYFSGTYIKGFLFFDVVIGLFLLDSYFRKQNSSKRREIQA